MTGEMMAAHALARAQFYAILTADQKTKFGELEHRTHDGRTRTRTDAIIGGAPYFLSSLVAPVTANFYLPRPAGPPTRAFLVSRSGKPGISGQLSRL